MACVTKRRGRWIVDFTDLLGKRRWITMPKGSTKAKAADKLREIEDKLARGVYLPEKRIPLFGKVAQDWLEYKKANIRLSTWRKYEGYTRNHYEDFKGIRINRISSVKIEKFINARQNEGMNISTLRKLITVLNQVMKYAIRHKYLDSNPVASAERPRERTDVDEWAENDQRIKVLIPEHIMALLDSEPDKMYRTLFHMAITTGAREGELFGLKWTDVDWFNSQLFIQRTFNEGAWQKPKSKCSMRKIDLGPATVAVLREWQKECPTNNLNLIFPNEAGGPLNHGNMLRRHFYPALEKAKCPRVRFHDLRHTYASLLIEQGENVKYVQNQLGHSTPMFTLTVYAHLMKSTNQKAVCKLENTIFQNSCSKTVAEKKKGLTLLRVNP